MMCAWQKRPLGSEASRLFGGYRGLFPLWQSCRGLKLTTHIPSATDKNGWSYASIPMACTDAPLCCSNWRNRVLLPDNLAFPQLAKKLPAFYGTRRFITAFTSARHLSPPWATSFKPMPPHFHCSCHTKGSVLVGALVGYFVTLWVYTVRSFKHHAHHWSWKSIHCQLSATGYSMYSRLPTISGDRSSICTSRTRYAVVTGTHLSRCRVHERCLELGSRRDEEAVSSVPLPGSCYSCCV